jgi:SAM-dependent methyltransferase
MAASTTHSTPLQHAFINMVPHLAAATGLSVQSPLPPLAATGIHFDDQGKCVFGKKSYWDTMYSNEEGIDGRASEKYSWYCTYDEFGPFWRMLVPDEHARVMIAGIGNDPSPVAMYDDGYSDMLAFDYSDEGVVRAKQLFGPDRDNIRLITADARDLPVEDASIDATLDKGTLDAIYITGKTCLQDSIKEITRVTAPGGVIMCISRVIEPADLMGAFDNKDWDIIHEGILAFAPDGEATIDLGAELYSWKRTRVAYVK